MKAWQGNQEDGWHIKLSTVTVDMTVLNYAYNSAFWNNAVVPLHEVLHLVKLLKGTEKTFVQKGNIILRPKKKRHESEPAQSLEEIRETPSMKSLAYKIHIKTEKKDKSSYEKICKK